MPSSERSQLIRAIERERGTRVISYITSTRPGLEVQMSMEVIRIIYDHLLLITRDEPQPKIDLFLHSNGGDGTVPWRLVTLIREYASEFNVLVPFRAFSAATLTCLGAAHVVMHPMAMLGPTDPTVSGPFNPPNPFNQAERIGISVEDVGAYIALVKEDVGITHEDELVQAFNILANNVHPLALGNVKRIISQSRMLARKLLGLHMNITEDHLIDEIVDKLTSKLFYHGHPINRDEARDQIGLATIEKPTDKVADLMWALYLDYEQEIQMHEPFNFVEEYLENPLKQPVPVGAAALHNYDIETGCGDILPTNMPAQNTSANSYLLTPPTRVPLAFIESASRTDTSMFAYQLSGLLQPTGETTVVVIQRGTKWEEGRREKAALTPFSSSSLPSTTNFPAMSLLD